MPPNTIVHSSKTTTPQHSPSGASQSTSKSKSLVNGGPVVEPISAFYLFAIVNVLAALFAPIPDCDEVFNYWEPTHYLNHKYGLQTWEYSPDYSIRSWLYIVIHAIVGKFGSLFSTKKSFEFYFIRVVLALTCALCESRLFTTVSRALNPRIGGWFMAVMLFSPGMFNASVAYLPSSFSMYTTMLGMTSFMDWRGGSKTHIGIMWFGIGAVVGWPFSAALVGPFVVEELILASITKDVEVFRRIVDGSVRSVIVLALQVAVDTFFYHKVVVVPWKIVSYNIFSGSGRGPDIFGTEPADFYIRNLLLNFNVWFILAICAGPLLVLQYVYSMESTTKFTLMRSAFFVCPFYMWLAIFSAQAHKEERFMFPMYPFLGLNAAIALHSTLAYVGNTDPGKLMSMIPARLKFAVVVVSMMLAVDIGILRTFGTITAYRAPLLVFSALQQPDLAKAGDMLCLGKEWYRFPSSYFLPNGIHAKFIRSDFNGLLPGEFNEAKVGFGLFAGTWLIPPGMNDKNIADPGKFFDPSHCSFLVDSYFPSATSSPLEPNYVLNQESWEKVKCSSFLDTTSTSMVGRILWLPNVAWIPGRYRRRWGQYCLLRRRTVGQ
ncbi:mannosyltransferase [Lambiella insularis]|nr:mannosyltransferase [Lambiella insularis]